MSIAKVQERKHALRTMANIKAVGSGDLIAELLLLGLKETPAF